MALRRLTWAEFNAWVQVTNRAELARRHAACFDTYQAARGDLENFEKYLGTLNGD